MAVRRFSRRHYLLRVAAVLVLAVALFVRVDRPGAQQELPPRAGAAVSALQCPEGDLVQAFHGDPAVDEKGKPLGGYSSPEEGLKAFLKHYRDGRLVPSDFRRGSASERLVQFVLDRARAPQAMVFTVERHGVWLVDEFVACNSLVPPPSGGQQ